MDNVDNFENKFLSMFEQDYRKEYGVHRWDLRNGVRLAALSAPNWQSFIAQIKSVKSDDNIAASPELIAATELATQNVIDAKALIERRIEEVKTASLQVPATMFLLGTPVFEGEGKPTNSVLYIKAGQVVGQTAKRSGLVTWEKANFRFNPEEAPSLIPGTDMGMLICSDLPLTSLYLRPMDQYITRVLELSHHEDLIGKKPVFIHPDAKNLVVTSCWGIGGMSDMMESLVQMNIIGFSLETPAP